MAGISIFKCVEAKAGCHRKNKLMEIEGTIIQVLGRQEGTSSRGNAWKKDEYVMETNSNSQFPRKVKFTIFGDKCETLRCEPGKTYRLQVDLESREFNGRWYTDVNCYALQEVGGGAAPASSPASPAHPYAPAAPTFGGEDKTDDLPF